MLRRRWLSSAAPTAFDARKWIGLQSGRLPIRAMLHKYQLLPPADKELVRFAAKGQFHKNIVLHDLLQTNSPHSIIFQHVVDHVGLGLSPELTEDFLFQLLQAENLNAVVSLVHVLLHSDETHYRLSVEFWSLLASKAGSLAHHAAASMVYHEVVNPHHRFHNDTSISDENEFISFLLLPTAIEALAVVFLAHGNHVAIQGLHEYFKRFYSYFGHKSVYRLLSIAKVESLAKSSTFENALKEFKSLAINHRGYQKYRNPKDVVHSLKYASHINYKHRQKVISENLQTDKLPFDTSGIPKEVLDDLKTFLPDIVYNKYTIPNGPYWAILDGILSVEDLPSFRELILDKIKKLNASASIVEDFIALIESSHFALAKFVIVSLCETGHTLLAIAIFNKISSKHMQIYAQTPFSTAEEFNYIFRALGELAKDKSISTQHFHKLLLECHRLCQKFNARESIPLSCRRSFMTAYLNSPHPSLDELTRILKSWIPIRGRKIRLPPENAAKLQALGMREEKINSFFSFL